MSASLATGLSGCGPAGLPALGHEGRPSAASRAEHGLAWAGPHPVNIRLSLPSPWGRFHLLLRAWPERRDAGRRRLERARDPLATLGNLLVIMLLAGLVGLAGLAAIEIATALLLGAQGPAQA